MKVIRPLLAAAALALLAACSTPNNLTPPPLAPQFGTADNDIGVDVALGSSGRVYALSEQAGYKYDEYGDQEGYLDQAILRRYDGSGNLLWSKVIGSGFCSYDADCRSDPFQVRSLVADPSGASYALVAFRTVAGDAVYATYFYVYKFDAAGNPVRSVFLGETGEPFASDPPEGFSDAAELAVDGGGNLYAVHQEVTYAEPYDIVDSYSNVVAKYSAAGGLQWQRLSTVGVLRSVSVSGNGNVYVGGSTGVAKYSNSGNLIWTKAGAATDLAAVGTNTVYARNLNTVRKLDATGKQLWSRAQTGLSGLVIGDMTTDSSANVYLTGKYSASSGNRDVFIRKLAASSGNPVFTKTFGTSAYDDARGVATLTGSDIFITGATQGALAHPFRGGENDGYVRKLNSSGNPVWTR